MKKIYFFVTGILISFGYGSSFAQCPTITCPANISVNNDAGTCGAVVTYTAPVGTDPCSNTIQTFNYTGSIVTWTVPAGVNTITIETRGAEGGHNNSSSTTAGLGAIMIGTFAVTPGDQLKILVGQQPTSTAGNGGGGGTFVTDISNNPLIIAGGGGGSSATTDSPDKHGQVGTTGGTGAAGGGTGGSAGSGGGIGPSGFQSGAGGGLLTNGLDGWTGGTGGFAFVNGGLGGATNAPANGGFGGGGSGSSYVVGGGGGGYSGGGSGGNSTAGVGGGGGSYNGGTAQNNTGGVNSGNGLVIINYSGGGTITTTLIGGLASGSVFPLGTTTQTYVVSDGLGNADTCSFTVTVNDAEPPVINPPANISVNNDNGFCSAVVSYTSPTVNDNCSATVITQLAGLGSGANFPVGITTETYLVTDMAGLTDTCSFTITVTDNEAPVFGACNNDVSVCTPMVNGIGPGTVTDNCAGSPAITYFLTGATTGSGSGDASGLVFNLGITVVNYVATDINMNSDTCSFNVIVNAIPTVSASTPDSVACINDPSILLNGSPAGGTWSGAGVSGNNFTPATAGVGTHQLSYLFTNAGGCSDSANVSIDVLGCAGINDPQSMQINIYPNPANDFVNILMDTNYELVEISLNELNGKNIRVEKLVEKNNIRLDISNITNGVYFLTVKTNLGTQVFKLLKK